MTGHRESAPEPAPLLADHLHLFTDGLPPGPVLDLACGNGHNAVFLASHGIMSEGCDVSKKALDEGKSLAGRHSVHVDLWQVDLEREGINPLQENHYGGILVFRYLHRPLFPCIRKALKSGGILVYETFTEDQAQFGKPRNPDHLLKPGELLRWFEDWEVLHTFEGILGDPPRAVAQLVCRKP